MTTRTYHWLHIPTNTRGTRTWGPNVTRLAALELLARWNGQQPGTWAFWG